MNGANTHLNAPVRICYDEQLVETVAGFCCLVGDLLDIIMQTATQDVLVIAGVILGLYGVYFALAMLSNRSVRRLSSSLERLDDRERLDLPTRKQGLVKPHRSARTMLAAVAGVLVIGLLLLVWVVESNK